jgi:hypothetical protein
VASGLLGKFVPDEHVKESVIDDSDPGRPCSRTGDLSLSAVLSRFPDPGLFALFLPFAIACVIMSNSSSGASSGRRTTSAGVGGAVIRCHVGLMLALIETEWRVLVAISAR